MSSRSWLSIALVEANLAIVLWPCRGRELTDGFDDRRDLPVMGAI